MFRWCWRQLRAAQTRIRASDGRGLRRERRKRGLKVKPWVKTTSPGSLLFTEYLKAAACWVSGIVGFNIVATGTTASAQRPAAGTVSGMVKDRNLIVASG